MSCKVGSGSFTLINCWNDLFGIELISNRRKAETAFHLRMPLELFGDETREVAVALILVQDFCMER